MSPRRSRLFHRDALIATVFTFMLIGLLGMAAMHTKYLAPIYVALQDFEYTDLYYSQYKSKQVAYSEAIVLVNIGNEDRAGIAEILEVVQASGPRLIGLDVGFQNQQDSASDARLKQALQGPLVLASQFNYADNFSDAVASGTPLREERSHPYFEVGHQGYGNFVAPVGKTVRYFQPAVTVKGDTLLSFVAQVLKQTDKAAFRQMMERNSRGGPEIINYGEKKFIVLSAAQIREDASVRQLFTDKYVLMGYMGGESGVKCLEDLHLTPLNKSFGGHAIPDTYGIEIHAHILGMALEGKYINTMSKSFSWAVAFLITLLHMYVFLRDFVDNRLWYHIFAKVVQFVSFLLILFLSIAVFHFAHLKVEPSLLLAAILFSVDALYLLDGIMKWLYKKYKLPTYFIPPDQ